MARRRVQDWSPNERRAVFLAAQEEFTNSYLETALWSSVDEDGRPLDDEFRDDDFSKEARKQAADDSADFLKSNWENLVKTTGTWAQHGHDFWLTRNHHGAGFWDLGYGVLGKLLTDAAYPYGELHVYAGDDGKLYFE